MRINFNQKEFVYTTYIGKTFSKPKKISPIIQMGSLVVYNHDDIVLRFVIEDINNRIYHHFTLNEIHQKSIDELFQILTSA
ncbi:hypothetical protein GCM10011339_11430 [Echinicola rosea]|uniref:Uncharacterized protein n=1 Tax=Echinicola rosea TaxID=1807691 RepID=A0ABQ1UQZ9_9BACT|nr:hypothetical protein GCM10011339_11430 [Echinicola rosea]